MCAKKPFSGKQKKTQLQQRRQRKSDEHSLDFGATIVDKPHPAIKPDLISQWDTRNDFAKQSPRFSQAYQEQIIMRPETDLEVSFEQVHGNVTSRFELPSRPSWSYGMSKDELERQEQSYFQAWQNRIYEMAEVAGGKDQLSYFEHNLEVWRQLWRVCEISQVIVVVVDVRHPVLHLPPSLYHYVSEELKKPMCVALMKTDLVRPSVVQAWKNCILQHFPNANITSLSIFGLESKDGKRPKRYQSAAGIAELVQTIQGCSAPKYAAEWGRFKSQRLDDGQEYRVTSGNAAFEEKEYFTIGFIGHPNAGKSSLINSIVGKKVVSASKTPGHTKHFQTIHLTSHLRLCDCPGLVFPMLVPKWLQVLSGIYNVAQVKDPYEAIMHLAEYVDLAQLFKLQSEGRSVLSVYVAAQKGFFTAKAARPDMYRAANWILRSVIDGKILLSWKPPGYYASDHASEDKVCESRLHEADNKTDEGSEDEDQEAEFGDAAGPDGDNSTRATRGGAFSALLDSEDSF